MNRNKLYSILLIACLAGYTWLYYSIITQKSEVKSAEVCLIKHFTGVPCPSCGSTRSVISLIHLNFFDAFLFNPLGYLVAMIMLLSPLWIIIDVIMKKNSLFIFYQKVENTLRKPNNAILFIVLILINWIWNIKKGL